MLAFEAPVRTICVTGMHRSGTSLGARALEALGVWFGESSLLLDPGSDNQTGYWESRPLKELNEDLLAHLGGSWDSPPVLTPEWERASRLDEFRAAARQHLTDVFGSAPSTSIGWKDPRLSVLLPFWRTVTPIDAVVTLVRDPADVAGSLHARNRIGPTQSHLLWLRYLLAVFDDPTPRVVIDYQSFFDDLEATLHRMADALELDAPGDEVVATVRRHFDPSLRHHSGGRAPRPDDSVADPVVELARQVWNGGAIAADALQPTVARAIAEGWLRPPVDTVQFDEARAQVVDLTELLRRRTRQRAAEATRSATPDADAPTADDDPNAVGRP